MFKEFTVKDVLNVEQTKSVVAKADLTEGDIPYVTRTVSDNGYMGTCGNKDKVNKGNCITIGAETGVAFYQPNDFVAGNKVYRLSREGLNMKEYLFLASILNMQTKNYSYSNARIPEKIKAEKIFLPVIENPNSDYEYTVDDIDWQYMRDRITELERDRITELERDRITELDAYLQATGLNDYELTEDDKKILSLSLQNSEDGVRFGEFLLKDIAKLDNGNKFDKNKMTYRKPSVYFVSRTASNNGVSDFVDNNGTTPYKAGCITLAFGGSIGSCFVQYNPFYTGQNVGVIDFGENVSFEAKQYIALCLGKYCKTVFTAFADEINKHFKKDLTISLPIKSDGTPDFDYMERYIRAMEKVVIADVVKYKDKVIETTKKVVGD